MSKPIDQERTPFDLAYSCAVENGWESTKELARYMWDQARAAVQPAGVAVPDGWKLVPVEPTDHMAWVGQSMRPDTEISIGAIYAAMLAAAPHPVSVEQKSADSHVPLYEAVQRAAGELPNGWEIRICIERDAGSVELFDADRWQVDDFPTNDERLDFTVTDALDAALAAHRAQQGEQPKCKGNCETWIGIRGTGFLQCADCGATDKGEDAVTPGAAVWSVAATRDQLGGQ